MRRYRTYMYQAGSIDRPDKGKVKVIDPRVLYREKRKDFQITQASRLRYRTRYFTDSGIIGSKEFVSDITLRVLEVFATEDIHPPAILCRYADNNHRNMEPRTMIRPNFPGIIQTWRRVCFGFQSCENRAIKLEFLWE